MSRRFWRTIRCLFRRDRFELELEEEMRLHVEMKREENLDRGMPPDEALRAARRALGNMTVYREESRDMWGFRWLENLAADLRYALRGARRNPYFTLSAVLSLALGIGPNVAIFSLLNEALLKDVTAKDPASLVHVDVGQGRQVSYPNYRDLAEARILDGLAAYTVSQESWRRGDGARSVSSHVVTANFFDVLGVQPALGRTFTAAEARPERVPQLVVASHGFWRRGLGADPQAVGRDVTLNGRPFTLVGVLPEGYRSVAAFAEAPEVYLPLRSVVVEGFENRSRPYFHAIGRLPRGVSARQAEAALDGALRRLERAHPVENRDIGRVKLDPLSGWRRLARYDAEVLGLAAFLLVVVGLVLLTACANTSSLLLARGVSRRREIAMRLALGASRGRLVRQLLTESLSLALAASAVALGFNYWLTSLLNGLEVGRGGAITLGLAPDRRLLVYAILVATSATLVCGLAPALSSTRLSVVPALKDEPHGPAGRRFLSRNLMVGAQVAAATLLLVVGALFLRSLAAVVAADPGFDVDRVLVVAVNLQKGGSANETLFFETATARLEQIPGVEKASCAGIIPLSFTTSGGRFWVDGGEEGPGADAYLNVVGRGYFATLGIPLLRGREIESTDRSGAPLVAVVNEAFARRHLDFPARDPIGRRLIRREGEKRDVVEVVGVARDSKYYSLGESPQPQVFLSYLHPLRIRRVRTLLVRAGSPDAALPAVKRALGELEPSAEIEVKPLRSVVELAYWPSRIGAFVLGGLGALGLLIAMLGLHGVLSYAVSRRTPEIGIRMALGASRAELLRMVLCDGLKVVATGSIAGLGAAAAVTGLLKSLLAAEVHPIDPASFTAVAVLMIAVGAAASLQPALRATKVDPLVALRRE